ncbi:hypothetical protein F5Y16DRAFT_385656 [Xylariaceae sp. FL0255]|nr:hypothetical protein F5Y16DRAFT_385656 [Xylariaceae sp. FL0255]
MPNELTNQSDPIEKPQQLQLMPSIYKCAYLVLVWLGPIPTDSYLEREMEFLWTMCSSSKQCCMTRYY